MEEKDMAEKTLESYNDVFADIINVLFFKGNEIVKEEELEFVWNCFSVRGTGGNV